MSSLRVFVTLATVADACVVCSFREAARALATPAPGRAEAEAPDSAPSSARTRGSRGASLEEESLARGVKGSRGASLEAESLERGVKGSRGASLEAEALAGALEPVAEEGEADDGTGKRKQKRKKAKEKSSSKDKDDGERKKRRWCRCCPSLKCCWLTMQVRQDPETGDYEVLDEIDQIRSARPRGGPRSDVRRISKTSP